MKNVFITKGELAQAYFPYIEARPARHKLMQVINDDAVLMASLRDAGYNPANRLLSPHQVEVIVERLGNPWK